MSNQLPILAVTAGDPAGIGPEITVMTVTDPAMRAKARAVVYGDPAILARAAAVSGRQPTINPITDPRQAGDDPSVIDVIDIGLIPDAEQIAFGQVQALAGRAAVTAIETAVADAVARRIDGVVTSPINKEAIWASGSQFLGHTELIQDLTHAAATDTMFVVGNLCVFFATRHMSLAEAVAAIKAPLIEACLDRALVALEVFGYPQPRLAVAALNPHGGEGGHFGREEIDQIAPAIAKVNATIPAGRPAIAGPIPADSVFHLGLQGQFDGILSLYHDQGHIATKTFDFDATVSVTTGLPILRTSVDHGTAFDIAGTGQASPATMNSAFLAGARFTTCNERIRQQYGRTQP
ncbi:MAG: 4-hydroxythreonine-4-phosphate dehydrogenase PdxA [Bifidobacteriaceae bacterium]|jgi:4-hydroxythreonine-4-phosphate dehydrogenase|nr:4-hydroxythreonine-4-phosphate dehydrogenase PdxA [Bifidobacteriaceae bacterium]